MDIVIKYNTKTKTCEVMKDGVMVENVSEIRLCKMESYESESDATFAFRMEQSVRMKDQGAAVVQTTYASEVREALKKVLS